MKKRAFWADILPMILETYLEFLISGYLNLKAPLLSTDGELYGVILGYFCLISAVIIVPIGFLVVIN